MFKYEDKQQLLMLYNSHSINHRETAIKSWKDNCLLNILKFIVTLFQYASAQTQRCVFLNLTTSKFQDFPGCMETLWLTAADWESNRWNQRKTAT